jgi:hypothetical protein
MSSQLLEALVNLSELRPKPPHPIAFFGAYIGPIDLHNHCWEATGILRDQFHNKIHSEIKDYLQVFFGSVPSEDRITVSFYMVGKSPQTAAPTVMFISENSDYRKDARKAIKASDIIVQYSGYKTAQLAKDPGFLKMEQLASGEESSKPIANLATNVLFDHTKPVQTFGMPLYICHSSSIRTATANAIRIGNRIFFQMAYHAFNESAPEKPAIADDDDFEIDSDSELDAEDNDDYDVAITSIGSRTPDSWSHSAGSDNGSSRRLSTFSGISTPTPETLKVSDPSNSSEHLQNASDKLVPFTTNRPTYVPKVIVQPCVDSLSTLGILVEWSVSKDWALVEIVDSEVQASLRVESWLALSINNFARTPKEDVAVTTSTASMGTLTGVLSASPSYTRFPNGTAFQKIYTVQFDGPLANGDCGAVVLDATNQQVYGHLVAGCRTTGSAYVLAAYQIEEDIQKFSSRITSDEISGEHVMQESACRAAPLPPYLSVHNPHNRQVSSSTPSWSVINDSELISRYVLRPVDSLDSGNQSSRSPECPVYRLSPTSSTIHSPSAAQYIECSAPSVNIQGRSALFSAVNNQTPVQSGTLFAQSCLPLTQPLCLQCGRLVKYNIVKETNRNGNAGRPYFTCIPCRKFHSFADERGNSSQNPLCYYNQPNRTQVARYRAQLSGLLHYVRRVGACDFYQVVINLEGRQMVSDEKLNALYAASSQGRKEVVNLLDKVADVNAQGRTYDNVLPAASYGGHEQVVKLLLNKGADVYQTAQHVEGVCLPGNFIQIFHGLMLTIPRRLYAGY